MSSEGIVGNPAQNRFELAVAGSIAAAYYRIEESRIILSHSPRWPQYLSGYGIGPGWPTACSMRPCERTQGDRQMPFMAAYASRQPEYASMLDD